MNFLLLLLNLFCISLQPLGDQCSLRPLLSSDSDALLLERITVFSIGRRRRIKMTATNSLFGPAKFRNIWRSGSSTAGIPISLFSFYSFFFLSLSRSVSTTEGGTKTTGRDHWSTTVTRYGIFFDSRDHPLAMPYFSDLQFLINIFLDLIFFYLKIFFCGSQGKEVISRKVFFLFVRVVGCNSAGWLRTRTHAQIRHWGLV